MQVVIHAGVAFTDEDRLFRLLRDNAEAMSNHSVAFWGARVFRRQFRTALNEWDHGSNREILRSSFMGLVPNDKTVTRTILTNPGYLGPIQTSIMDGQFYPLAGERVAFMEDAFEGMPIELFLGLRNPGSFISKAVMAQTEADRQRVLAETDLSCLSWLTLIDNIRDLAPDVRITLWRNEDSPLIWGDIARAMAALPDDTPLNGEYALLSSLVSEAGRAEIEALTAERPVPIEADTRLELSRIFETYALPEAIEEELDLPGWNDDIIAAFNELYEQDMDVLQTMSDVRFLKP